MSEVLPLLLLPAVLGWWISEIKQRRARTSLHVAIARARRPMLADAGRASVIDVARSLESVHDHDRRPCPWWRLGRARTAWEVRQLAAPLGLELVEVIRLRRDRIGRPVGFTGASRFEGARRGRKITVHLGATASAVTVHLSHGVSVQPCRLVGDATGTLDAHGEVPVALAAALDTLASSRHWRGVDVAVRPDRIELARPATAASWLHDLWLTEFVADMVAPVAPSRASGHAAPHASGAALLEHPSACAAASA
jgi:hypothetical protein